MTDGYDCYQKAFAERINAILKQSSYYINDVIWQSKTAR